MFKNTSNQGLTTTNEALVTYQTPMTFYEKEFQLDERMTFQVETNLR